MRLTLPLAAGLATLALCAAPAPKAEAHHCFPAVFDAAAPVTVTGKILKVEWINPHAMIYVAGSDAGKPDETFVFWTATPNTLLRNGLTRLVLAEGTQVTVRGFRGHDKTCAWSSVIGQRACLADARDMLLPGQRRAVFVGGSGANAPIHPDVSASVRAGLERDEAATARGAGWCANEKKP